MAQDDIDARRRSAGSPGRPEHTLLVNGASGSVGGAAVQLIESERFSPPVTRTFRLAEVADAHRVGESGLVRAKLVLPVGPVMGRRPHGGAG